MIKETRYTFSARRVSTVCKLDVKQIDAFLMVSTNIESYQHMNIDPVLNIVGILTGQFQNVIIYLNDK